MSETQNAATLQTFSDVSERGTADTFLRTAQQTHVQLSMMADTKANIVITVSSIVLTMALGRLDSPQLGLSAATLGLFTLAALILAILAVLPKFRPIKLSHPDAPLPDSFNLLFFGHFSELSQERFLQEINRTMQPHQGIYLSAAKDLYALGSYLAHYKYRYLRWSYLSFLTGFVSAILVQICVSIWA